MHHFDMQVSHDPRLHDPDPGPQEKSTEKRCVSFGKDCMYTAARNRFFSKYFQTQHTYQHLVENRNLYSILPKTF